MSVCSMCFQGAKKSHWLIIQKRRLKNGEIGAVVTSIEELNEGCILVLRM